MTQRRRRVFFIFFSFIDFVFIITVVTTVVTKVQDYYYSAVLTFKPKKITPKCACGCAGWYCIASDSQV